MDWVSFNDPYLHILKDISLLSARTNDAMICTLTSKISEMLLGSSCTTEQVFVGLTPDGMTWTQ